MLRRIFLIFLLHSSCAQADCWERAGQQFGITPKLLYAIAQQESGLNPQAINQNKDGSKDLGLMQINSVHFPRLKALGIKPQHLQQDGCLSVMVGASILSDMMKRYGYSWEAVGAYNAGTAANRKALRMHYAKQVWQRYQRLQPASKTFNGPAKHVSN